MTGDSAGARLEAIHRSLGDTPLPEWLEAASCGPAAKHLAHLAMRAADAGCSEAQWREWVRAHVPEASDKLVEEAAGCMRGAGLWPWHGGTAKGLS